MRLIVILIAKVIAFVGGIFHRGSSLPGKIALKLDENILDKLKYPRLRIMVTGSSGKGGNASLIAGVLSKSGLKVCFNEGGSNLAWGCASAILKYTSLTGKVKADAVVLEVDERYTPKISKALNPNYMVITGLSKDQPPRQHTVDFVFDVILSSIPEDAVVVTNMDDPYLRKFEVHKNIIYFGLDKNKYSYKKQIFENLNTYHCPKCHDYLEYDYFNFETLGKYKCKSCEFTYIEPKVKGKALDLDTKTIEIDKHPINIGGDMLYNAYNTVSAITLLLELDLDKEFIYNTINELNEFHPKYYKSGNKWYYPIYCKGENATTYNQAIFKVISNKEPKDIIIGRKRKSLRYDYYDVSWLYDIEFELLNNDTVKKVYAVGIDARALKKRLLLAGFNKKKIVTADTFDEIKDKVTSSSSKWVFGILNSDHIDDFKNTFKKDSD